MRAAHRALYDTVGCVVSGEGCCIEIVGHGLSSFKECDDLLTRHLAFRWSAVAHSRRDILSHHAALLPHVIAAARSTSVSRMLHPAPCGRERANGSVRRELGLPERNLATRSGSLVNEAGRIFSATSR